MVARAGGGDVLRRPSASRRAGKVRGSPDRVFGAVIGTAMELRAKGKKGLVLVWVALQ